MGLRLASTLTLCATILAVLPLPSAAQVSTGRIDVAVTDSSGAILAGATVMISGPQKQTSITEVTGEAHFLNLPPGTYTVTARQTGFSDYFNKHVGVATGASVPLQIALSVAGVATQVQVTSETPVVDTKKLGTSTNVSFEELQNLPSARDPWAVLQTIPGVVVDRVNVGGSESGQQSNYIAKGASSEENTWNMDGVAITDMAALGASPTYYDFDMFQDMQVTTGGADITSPTPGVQLGGPLVKDRLWAWGALGKTHVDLITLDGTHDRTELQDSSFKASGQLTSSIRANYTFFRGDKDKFGRSVGPTRSEESTYDQSGPTTMNKVEGDFVLGNRLFVAARASNVDGAFTLAARGGPAAQMYVDDAGVVRGSTDTYVTDRPQKGLTVDANSFRGHHEFKFGFSWRKATVDSSDAFPGNGLVTTHNGYPDMIAKITRSGHFLTNAVYTSAYAGDTWTMDRATLNLGIRWDRSAASLGSASVPGSPVVPNLLPGLTSTAADDAVVVNSISPRLGLNYALDAARKTMARASYAAFASQLNATVAGTISSIQYSAIYYHAIDANGNRIADPGEIRFDLGHLGYYGFDLSNPSRLTTINRIGDYGTPRTQEVMLGFDRELMKDFGVSGTFTYRYFDHLNFTPLIGVNSSDYVQTGTLSGNAEPIGTFDVPFYALRESAAPVGGGVEYRERAGYHQTFKGFEVSAVKRLSNRWMARFGFSTNSNREYFDDPVTAIIDPTPTPGNPNVNGGEVMRQSTGSGKSNIWFVLPRYQFIANGMYQLRWGLNIAGNVVTRQGYAEPFFKSNVPTGDPLSDFKSVLVVGDASTFRLTRTTSADARLEKAFTFVRANVMLDL